MKPLPAPQVSGKTDLEPFDNALRKVLSVAKDGEVRPKPPRPPRAKTK